MNRMSVPAKLDYLDEVTDFVGNILESCGCDMKLQLQVRLAVEEVFVNIASYAYSPGSGDAEIEAEIQGGDEKKLVVRFIDSGKQFDPTKKEDADTSEDALLERVGGLGILLVKKNMDDVSYSYTDHKNTLTIVKKL